MDGDTIPARPRRFRDGGRALPRGLGVVYEPCPLDTERTVSVCRSCRGEMVTDAASRTTYCPRCTLPPPPEVDLDVEVWEPGQLEALPWWLYDR
jgi:hypothetical protein